MLNSDTERILIATWAAGMHREDIHKFKAKHFSAYQDLFEIFASGETDPLTIVRKCGMKPNEYAELANDSVGATMYQSTMEDANRMLAWEWIAEHQSATPSEVSAAMDEFYKKHDPPKESKDPVGNLIEELERRENEKPIHTGLTDLDRMLCGIRRKELTAVGARPSVGKSAFLQQIGVEVAKQGEKVLFFPLEMSETSVMQRMLLGLADIPQYEIRNGLSRNSWVIADEAFTKMYDFMNTGLFKIYERCNDLQDIRNLIKSQKPYIVIIDQLEQLKDGDKNWDGKRDRFSYMTHELQAISLDMNVAVWFACQINRSAENTPPTMANLKESGTIEEDSTNVILLHRDGPKAAMQLIQIELAKQKDGECGAIMAHFTAPRFNFYCTENNNGQQQLQMPNKTRNMPEQLRMV